MKRQEENTNPIKTRYSTAALLSAGRQTAGHSLLRNTHENEAGMGPLMSFPFVIMGFSKCHSPPQLQY
jgi:hypothetical protein